MVDDSILERASFFFILVLLLCGNGCHPPRQGLITIALSGNYCPDYQGRQRSFGCVSCSSPIITNLVKFASNAKLLHNMNAYTLNNTSCCTEDTFNTYLQYFLANNIVWFLLFAELISVLCAIHPSWELTKFQKFPTHTPTMAEDLYKLSWQQFRENITANFR